MTSSVNSTNSSRRGSCCPVFLARCCSRRARPPQEIASSLDARVVASAARILESPPSNETPILDRRVSLLGTGHGSTSNVAALIRGSDLSARRAPFGGSSPDLSPEVGIEFAESELGRTLRSVSVRSPGTPFSNKSPLMRFINSPASFEGYTPPPKNSEKYDSCKYYSQLAVCKGLEDFPFFRERFPSSEAAFAYLASIMPTSGYFLEESYLRVNALLLGISDPMYRREKVVSFCLVPEESVSVLKDGVTTMRVDEMFQEEGLGQANVYKELRDGAGCIYFIYQIIHSPDHIAEKLQGYINEFNLAIDVAESPGFADPVNKKLDAIILFFLRCEQLHPVKQSHRTNLAVLNYLLAKYNFPCVLFKDQIQQISGHNVSMLDYLNFEDLRKQVILGMENWCKKAGIAYPFS